MTKSEELKALNKKWFKECKCGLRKTATQPVPGNGNPRAEIVFIGEAPGKSEDREGKPFIGGAGKFLDEMLGMIRMKRNDIYITNIVKYRPPENRDPEPSEKEACREWLHEELKIINPLLIVFLGRHSMNDFFPDLKISTSHGRFIKKQFPDIKTQYFLPLYHPASALYNGGMRDTLGMDFKKIPGILKMIKEEMNPTKIPTPIEKVPEKDPQVSLF